MLIPRGSQRRHNANLSGTARRPGRPRRAAFRPHYESLEDRTLLNAGALDTTFGAAGKALTSIAVPTLDSAQAAAVQPDGKVIVVGSDAGSLQGDFAITRYNPDGNLDAAFGQGGRVTTDFLGGSDAARGVVVQPDGKIVVVGSAAAPGSPAANSFALARYNPDGSPDTTFGTGGKVTTALGANGTANGVVLQPDGKIVVVGSSYTAGAGSFAVARYNPNGTLDPVFGTAGKVLTAFPASSLLGGGGGAATAAALQADGKIVVVGSGTPNANTLATDLAVVRYNANGTLDGTFGLAGRVFADLGSANDQAAAVGLQGDGKIVVAGSYGAPGQEDLALLRLNANGTPDAGFGKSGRAVAGFHAQGPEAAAGLFIQGDGKILAVGTSSTTSGPAATGFALARFTAAGVLDTTFGSGGRVTVPQATVTGASAHGVAAAAGKLIVVGTTAAPAAGSVSRTDFIAARFNADGTIDTAFGGGKVATNFAAPGDSSASAMVLQPDGRVVVAGYVIVPGVPGNPVAVGLTRYNPDGSVDASFGSGGQAVAGFGNLANVSGYAVTGLALQADGKLVVAGSTGSGDFALERFTAAGSLDTAFGSGGQVATHFGNGQGFASGVVVQPDGKIVAAGAANMPGGGLDFALARYNPDGTPDATFGTGGQVTTDFGGTDSAASLALQADGKIVLAGLSLLGGGQNFAVARYNPNGTLDTTFGAGGKVTTAFAGSLSAAFRVVAQADGKILAGGQAVSGSNSNFALARYNPDGSLDVGFGSGGQVTTDFGGSEGITDLAVRADDTIQAVGLTSPSPGVPHVSFQVALARYNADGSLDAGFGTGGLATADLGGTFDPRGSHVAFQDATNILVAATSGDTPAHRFVLARFQGDAPGGSLGFSAAAYVVNDIDGKATITVVRQGNTANPVTVQYATSGGTAQPGTNYVPTAGTLSFAAGQASQTFTVSIINSSVIEGSKTVLLTLSNPTGGAGLGVTSSAVLTILNTNGSSNQRFLAKMYLDLVHRPIDAGAMGYWMTQLNHGTARSQVVFALETSREFRALEVQGMFQTLLGRTVDSTAVSSFVNLLAAGWTVERVEGILLGSSEYFTRAGSTNAGFLAALYRDVLGRPIDPGTAAGWLNLLAAGVTRDYIIAVVASSGEALQFVVNTYYQRYLHRPADAAGVALFVNYFQHGGRDEGVIASLLGSAEYFAST
jgi:uncharacterized delta-60 repeat protein